MSTHFKRHNTAFETANPGDPTYVDTGLDTATSIERLNNGEDADEDVMRRPDEQLRRRVAHLGQEINLFEEYSKSFEGRFIDMGSTSVTWDSSTGIFSLSGAIKIVHPMYSDTVYEMAAATIGNSGVGFFSSAANRLKENGDSIWVTFGTNGDSTYGLDLNARVSSSTTALAITQAYLRKAPTWIAIKDTSTNLGSLGIVPGSDVVRIYPDPITLPAFYIQKTVKSVFQDEDGYWYLEVSYDTPLWDQTNVGDEVPPVVNTNKLTRNALGAEYVVLDSTYATTRLASTAFAEYVSNLHWFKRGRLLPVLLHGSPSEYREMEWQLALPLCHVSDGKLFFPLANVGGIATSTSAQSLSGFVRTSVSDNVLAGHVFQNEQSFRRAAGDKLITLSTTSDQTTVGRPDLTFEIEEAHTDGTSHVVPFWLSPARPGRLNLFGNADGGAQPIMKIAEQGFFTSGGAEQFAEAAIELRMPGVDPADPTTHGSRFSRLRASQVNYIRTAANVRKYTRELTRTMDETYFPTIAGPGGKGTAIGTSISLGTTNLYETLLGKHDIQIFGQISMEKIFPAIYNLTAGTPAGPVISNFTNQAVRFYSVVRLEQGTPATPNTPFVLYEGAISPSPTISTKIRRVLDPTDPSVIVSTYTDTQTLWDTLACAITADGGPPTENTSYPASPDAGGITVFTCLFKTDLLAYSGGGPWITTHTANHSEVLLKIVGYPQYDGGTSTHFLEFYAQWVFHTEEGDASEADRLRKLMYMDNFGNNKVSSASYGVDPTCQILLNVEHSQVWA